MAYLRFSHILLILALGTWILAFIINLFFPAFLYSIEVFPSVLAHTLGFMITLCNLLPSTENNILAMICFLLAMACSFVAGAVYGVEREAESQARQAAEFKGFDNYHDLEKGHWEQAEYSEKDTSAYPDAVYIDIPLNPPASLGDSRAFRTNDPEGDGMTGFYYPSAAESDDIAAQAAAQRSILARPQSTGRSSLELYLFKRACQQLDDSFSQRVTFGRFVLPIESVSFATRKLTQEKERLEKELEKTEH